MLQFLRFSVIMVYKYKCIIFTEEEIVLGTYNLPRDVKGEGRILFVFSTKALIYSTIGAAVGLPVYLIFSILNLNIVGIIAILLFALIGFVIGTFKVPEIPSIKATKDVGGENIDEVIKRFIKFKSQHNKVYVYEREKDIKEGGTKDEC